MKKFIFGCCTFLIVLLAVVMFMTRGVAGAADQFIGHVSRGELIQAYGLCGQQITVKKNQEEFEEFLRSSRLIEVESVSWSSRKVENQEGKMEGRVTLKGGDEIPIEMILEKVEGEWKIAGIDLDIKAPSKKMELPDEPTALGMVKQVLDGLNVYMEKQDTAPLVALCDRTLGQKLNQKEIVDGFLANFKPGLLQMLFKQELKLSEPPKHNENGFLVLVGQTHPTEEGIYMAFNLTYMAESKEWKLNNLNLSTDQIKPAGNTPTPK